MSGGGQCGVAWQRTGMVRRWAGEGRCVGRAMWVGRGSDEGECGVLHCASVVCVCTAT